VAREFGEYVEADRYERSEGRKEYRNGHRTRSLMTTWGLIEDIRVPRGKGKGLQPKTFERYKGVHKRVDEGVLKMFLMGVSTRKVGDVLKGLLGYTLSASYLSRVAKKLDEEVSRFFDRSLDDRFKYLFLEGVSINLSEVSRSVRKVVLVAYGLRWDGSRELIDFRVCNSEGSGSWSSFLGNLKVRGLRGPKFKLIISDGCPGLWRAAEEVYPLVAHQLCWVHKLRNVANPADGGTPKNTSRSASPTPGRYTFPRRRRSR